VSKAEKIVKDGNAKAYQVRQVLEAIDRLEAENQEGDDDA
jgi:hypothetical protein